MLGVTSRMTITAEGLAGMSLEVIVKALSFQRSVDLCNLQLDRQLFEWQ